MYVTLKFVTGERDWLGEGRCSALERKARDLNQYTLDLRQRFRRYVVPATVQETV